VNGTFSVFANDGVLHNGDVKAHYRFQRPCMELPDAFRVHTQSKATNDNKKVCLMSCLICAGPAEQLPSIASWEERKCSECGHYRVSETLILALMDQGQIFDVPKARAWLADQQMRPGVPQIETAEGLLVILPD